jgi:hypothetical protein
VGLVSPSASPSISLSATIQPEKHGALLNPCARAASPTYDCFFEVLADDSSRFERPRTILCLRLSLEQTRNVQGQRDTDASRLRRHFRVDVPPFRFRRFRF